MRNLKAYLGDDWHQVTAKITKPPERQSKTGYGINLPSQYMVKHSNRWYRVYMDIFSNIGKAYIKTKKRKIIVYHVGIY